MSEAANTYEVVVVGAGSGGIGAALAAGRLGLRVLLLEKAPRLGGNAALGGVSVWEMGVGGTGIPFTIYKRLKQLPEAVGIYEFSEHCAWPDASGRSTFPAGAWLTINPALTYLDTLRRHGAESLAADEAFVRRHWHGVPFEPAAYQQVVETLLAELPTVEVRTGVSFTSATERGGRVEALRLSDGTEARARYFIDATESGFLCQAVGAQTLYGQEPRSRFDEPSAPEVPTPKVNGVSLIFRIAPRSLAAVDPLPAGIPADCWWSECFPLTSFVQYPNGDFNVNMLPTMDGGTFRTWDPDTVREECRRRTLAHWHYLQSTFPRFQRYTRIAEAEALGVRESTRILGEYVLTEHDVRAGLSGQAHPDLITLVDHPMDTHGNSTGRAGCVELAEPYGVPFRCLIPRGFQNLLIASRGASLSSLAASSCRLSRTMMQLGQAAGTAVFVALEAGLSTWDELDYQVLRAQLEAQHVQLHHPLKAELLQYLAEENEGT
ncbi:hypothetical protein GCM10027275_21500 [Rhabdobacter roseus]|uniref:FAD-dependent oxidoreductase n=1 Tax=Rhabdobacter roseus TaxID=1655419 RepID=A0A840TMC7_9BACT|nr:FAD-dependent oxidoreductase [Rhabdobacter roseus]MBB5284085.1 hypothetical protein [Rhabdobacter roseus]